jgi:hypothetical protein
MHSHPDPKRRWKFGILFAGTLFSKAYDWIPKKARVEGYNEKRLMAHVNRLKAMHRKGKKLPQSWIWFDDLQGILTQNTPFFLNLVTTARHLGINIIIAAQYLNTGLNTTLRAQCNYALLWKTKQERALKMCHREFGQLFPSYDDFAAYLQQATAEKYSCVCYMERSDDIDSNYHVIRAPKDMPHTKLEF